MKPSLALYRHDRGVVLSWWVISKQENTQCGCWLYHIANVADIISGRSWPLSCCNSPPGSPWICPCFTSSAGLVVSFGSSFLVTAAASIVEMYDPARAACGVLHLGSVWDRWSCVWSAPWRICGPSKGLAVDHLDLHMDVSLLPGYDAFPPPGDQWGKHLVQESQEIEEKHWVDRLRSQSDIDAAHHTTRDRLTVLGRAVILLFTEFIVFVMDTFTALVYGVLSTWFLVIPLVFGGIYGFHIVAQGLVYVGIFVGLVIAVPLYLL